MLANGRVVVTYQDSPVTDYYNKQHPGQFAVGGSVSIATASQVPQEGGQVILPLEGSLRNGNGGNDLLLAVVRIQTVVVRTHKARYVCRAIRYIAEVVADEGLST